MPQPLTGIDVSHHNGRVDWPKVRAAGFAFAFAKATEGTSFRDPRFAENWAGIKAAGLLRGAYHFARPGSSEAIPQADWLLRTVGAIGPGDLPLVLDLEVSGDLPPARLVAWTRAFLTRVEQRSGRRPILYTGPGFWPATGGTTEFRAYPLWEAHYTSASSPRAFGGWPSWTFWQWTSEGRAAGVAGNCDLNRYAGTRADLERLAGMADDEGDETVALSPELKAELDKLRRDVAKVSGEVAKLSSDVAGVSQQVSVIRRQVGSAYNLLHAGDDNPAAGDQRPDAIGLTDVLAQLMKRLAQIEKKIDDRIVP